MVTYQSRTEGPGWLRLLLITILMSLALVWYPVTHFKCKGLEDKY